MLAANSPRLRRFRTGFDEAPAGVRAVPATDAIGDAPRHTAAAH